MAFLSARLDQHLVAAGLASSRARAKALIEAGAVTVDGAVARKPAQAVATGAEVTITADPCPWVSRAALKLIHALDEFGLTPRGVALDLGACRHRARGFARHCAVHRHRPGLDQRPRPGAAPGQPGRDEVLVEALHVSMK